MAEFASGRMRPEWSWVVADDHSRLIGRALWWGRDGSRPLARDVLAVDAPTAQKEAIGTTLLRTGHAGLARLGHASPLAYTVRLPNEWHDRPDSREAVLWRSAAAGQSGLTLVNERLQLEWTPGQAHQPDLSWAGRLTFRPGDDAEFVELFAQTASGSLDVMTRRSLSTLDAHELAREELDYYRSCPGERGWWQVATSSEDEVLGFVIPSATPSNRNVGYLGVLPRYRGHGYVHELLQFVTRFHAASGAPRITATTDAANVPMATALGHAGYDVVERRLDIQPAP
ncbi:MAG: GNAT family N-acetyltransferase [Cryobacterium sp.]|nr:GNAT family N-acetyltransferase [Cryobacterium sp.]